MELLNKILMTGIKPMLQTILFSSIPIVLQDITPVFAFFTAVIGTFYIFFKCWNEIILWRKNRTKKDS